jgi:hypothetical protein
MLAVSMVMCFGVCEVLVGNHCISFKIKLRVKKNLYEEQHGQQKTQKLQSLYVYTFQS